MLRSVTPHTKVQLDTVDAGLAERMIGVDEGGVREEGFERTDVFLVRECLVPVRDVRRVDASARSDVAGGLLQSRKHSNEAKETGIITSRIQSSSYI